MSAENSTLIANKNGIGNFEKFYLFPVQQNYGVLITLKSLGNKKFLSLNTDTLLLKLNKEKAESGEKFYLEKFADGNYSIRAYSNNKFFHENIGKSILEATKDQVEDAEQFTIIKNTDPDGSHSIKTFSSRKYLSFNNNNNVVLLINKKTIGDFEKFYI